QIYDDGRIFDQCAHLYDEYFGKKEYGNFRSVIFFIRRTVYSSYDVIPSITAIIYILAAVILFYKRSSVHHSRNSEWKILLHGLAIFLVYGIATVINYLLSLYYECNLTGSIAQFLIFLYTILDVTTVLSIPLSVFFTVPSLRETPLSFIRR
ncbi:hypothetical protein PFISCL1PPCAC_15165, partial [Pristionchus fissidentatus]